jgi:hypothetical protein
VPQSNLISFLFSFLSFFFFFFGSEFSRHSGILRITASLLNSLWFSPSLSNLSLGWDEKKRRTRKKKERAGEKEREKKKNKGACVILKMKKEGNFLQQIAAVCTNLTAQNNTVCMLNDIIL